jgi:hypothetical protein
LLVDGVVSFSEEEHCWVAAIDWNAIHHASEEGDSHANGDNNSPPGISRESSRGRPCN